jgi:hypothetical protein
MKAALALVCLAFGVGIACLPDDEEGALGSTQFSFTASALTEGGVSSTDTSDGWWLRFDRVVLGFKTVTIGALDDRCGFRGRAAESDVVFDPRVGIVQTFNGRRPGNCANVGILLGPPGRDTELSGGATSQDMIDLSSGDPAHALVEATAKLPERGGMNPFAPAALVRQTLRIVLRFDARTSTTFRACSDNTRGATAVAGERDLATIRFGAERLFQADPSLPIDRRVEPFAQADRDGNGDGIVTMSELDAVSLAPLAFPRTGDGGEGTLPIGVASFGDYVRFLFRTAFTFRDEGVCIGVEPGKESER